MSGVPNDARKQFQAIVAMSLNRVIGVGQRLPWHLPEDFRWFKEKTTGHILVMGRKTFESIGRVLPNRETIVVSRTGFRHPEVRTVSSLDGLDPRSDPREFFVCGGGELYRAALPRCSDLYLTLVKREVSGDVFFPAFEQEFDLASRIRETPEFEVRHYRRRACRGC